MAPPRKKSKLRSMADYLAVPNEPSWDGAEDWDRETLDRAKGAALNWYAAHSDTKKLEKNLIKWMKQAKYKDSEIKAVAAVPDKFFVKTPFAIATMLLRGMPDNDSAWLRKKIEGYIEFGKPLIKKKKETKKDNMPSIQSRMAEQLDDIIGEFETWEDNIICDLEFKLNIFEWLKARSVAQVHIGKIKEFYQGRYNELIEAQEKDCDEQLKEAYAHYKKKDFKRFTDFYAGMFTDLDAYEQSKKVARKTRVKKAPSKEKLVAKMKFKQDDTTYKISSISPTNIIGAMQLWIFNCKTRKLGKYVADATSELSVKGTTITGFDEKLSVMKTVRKPDEMLPLFMKSGKVKLRKFLEDIKATEVQMNGRINKDTVLLKVQ